MASEHIHFVTGRLAEHSLRKTVESLAREIGFGYSIDVLPITVAALMTPEWIAKRIKAPAGTTRVLVPGYCSGDLTPIQEAVPACRSNADRAICENCRDSSVKRRCRPTTARTISKSLPKSIIVRDCRSTRFASQAVGR